MPKTNKIILKILLVILAVYVFAVAAVGIYLKVILKAIDKEKYTFETVIGSDDFQGRVVLRDWSLLRTAGVEVYYVPEGKTKEELFCKITYRNEDANVIKDKRFSYKITDGVMELLIDAGFTISGADDGREYSGRIRIASASENQTVSVPVTGALS